MKHNPQHWVPFKSGEILSAGVLHLRASQPAFFYTVDRDGVTSPLGYGAEVKATTQEALEVHLEGKARVWVFSPEPSFAMPVGDVFTGPAGRLNDPVKREVARALKELRDEEARHKARIAEPKPEGEASTVAPDTGTAPAEPPSASDEDPPPPLDIDP